jgi:hypothetical protein
MIANLLSKTKWILSKTKWMFGVITLIAAIACAVLMGARLPAWLFVLLGSIALALLYTFARLRSLYDPLDPRFGSCIPPINTPRAVDSNSSSPARSDVGEQ